jgi:hypothetical protein
MKEKILTKIREKIGKTSLSERTLSQKAERLAKKVAKEEDITDELIAEAVGDLKDIEGQLNHDVAEKVKEAEKKFADRQTEPNGGAGGGGSQGGAGNDMPAWFSEFQKQQKEEMESLKRRFEEEKSLAVLKAHRADLKSRMTREGAEKEYFLDVVLGRIQKIEESKSIDDAVKEALSEYDKEVTRAFGEGASPRSGGNAGGNAGGTGGNENRLKDFFAGKKAEKESETGFNKS